MNQIALKDDGLMSLSGEYGPPTAFTKAPGGFTVEVGA
jgi:hypothetical protein